MERLRVDALVNQLRGGHLDRRQFMSRAGALGLSAGAAAALARTAGAQDASPSASPSPGASPAASPGAGGETGYALTSITREEYWAAVREQFQLEEPGQEGGIVIYGETSDIRVLNPNLSTDVYSGLITGYIFDGLVSESPIDGFPAPGLADYWERSDDGLTYTFHLNQAATWHDGQPVTADDVVFSFESALAEGSLSPRKSTVEEYLAGVEKVDDYTVALTGKERYATFIENTAAQILVIPRHIWESVDPANWGSDPGNTGQDPSRVIGSGPFTFREWITNDHVTIDKRADHWDPNVVPVIDEFTFRVIPEASAAIQAFEAGEIDIVGVEPPQIESLRQSTPDATYSEYDTTGFNYYIPLQDPAQSTLFVDVPVRQAMLYAIDRQLMAEQIYLGYAIQADGSQPVLSVAYRPDQVNTIYNYDTARASQLLEEAGWAAGDDGIRAKDGVRFSFECLFPEGVATYEQLLPYLQQAWREVGIEMVPASVPFPSLIDAINSGAFQMGLLGFSWSVDGGQGDMFRCNAVPPAGFNRMRYCNERYDELDLAQALELDPARRVEIVVEASNLINDEAANGILVFSKAITASQPRLHNYLPNGYSEFWSLPFVWVEGE